MTAWKIKVGDINPRKRERELEKVVNWKSSDKTFIL